MLKRQMLTPQKCLTESEYASLVQLLEKHKSEPKDQRNVTLLFLMLATGVRASEALALTGKSLQVDNKSIFIESFKGSNDREFPVPPWLFKRLASLADGDARLFPISYSRLVQIWHHYRPVKKKLHSLRHTFAVRFYRRTLDIRLLQKALGHRFLSNTTIYLDYTHTVEQFRKGVEL